VSPNSIMNYAFVGYLLSPSPSDIKELLQKSKQIAHRITVVGTHMARWLVGWNQGY